jgi:hypothetical protein
MVRCRDVAAHSAGTPASTPTPPEQAQARSTNSGRGLRFGRDSQLLHDSPVVVAVPDLLHFALPEVVEADALDHHLFAGRLAVLFRRSFVGAREPCSG